MADVLRLISIIFILLFIFLVALSKRIKISDKQMKLLFFLFAVSLSCLAYYVNPPISWDLVRHEIWIESVRTSGISFQKFVFGKSSIGGGYVGLYTFNFLRWVIISITKNNRWLSTLCVFIDYVCVGYIFVDWLTENRKINILSLLLCFSFLPYVFAVSNIRTAFCASLLALGVYLYLYKKKRTVVFFILAFLAITVHPVGLIVIPFVFVAKRNWRVQAYIILFAISFLSSTIAELMLDSKYIFFQMIGSRFLSYTSDEQYRSSRAPLYVVFLLIVIFLTIHFLENETTKDIEDNGKKAIYNFLTIYMIYILGNFGNYDMVLRPAYVLGPLSPILVSWIVDKKMWVHNKINIKVMKGIRIGVLLACMSLCIYLNYTFLAAYSAYFIT